MKIQSFMINALAIILIVTPAALITSASGKNETLGDLFAAEGFPIFLVFLALVIVAIIYSKSQRKKSQAKWESGVFDNRQLLTEDSLLQAYVRLGGLMLRKDKTDLKGKLAYLHRYFDHHFENSFTDLSTAMKGSYQHPVELSTITPWLKAHLRSTSQRSQLLYFLAGLSAVDGSINPNEKAYLKQLAEQIDLSKKDFDSIMAMYSKYEEAFHNQYKQQRRAPSKSRSQYKREKAAEILGVSINASMDEIKKAYRSLAKVHHPDRFAAESESQQKIAKERFVKIQLAYELLEEFKN